MTTRTRKGHVYAILSNNGLAILHKMSALSYSVYHYRRQGFEMQLFRETSPAGHWISAEL